MENLILAILCLWFIGLGHAVWNTKLQGGEKVAWILFILFANWIGALVYFVFWFGFARRRQSQPLPSVQQSSVHPRQSHPSNEPGYLPYGYGYQPARTVQAQGKPIVSNETEQEVTASSLYEEPLVMYPEDPR